MRRQLEISERYAREHGLVLDDQLNLHDLGVSAFRGKNKTTGALATFLEAISAKKVPPGSYLLLESLDRLSRAQMTEAIPTFLEIINAGVIVVTLADEMTYSKGSLDQNMGNLMMSLVIMARAHEESATKSKRLSAAWVNKRRAIGERKLTAQAPGWLALNATRTAFEKIPERVRLVRRLFALADAGHGKRSIAKSFNQEGIEPWGKGKRRGNGWHDSYIQKILANRAVLGEFQPHRMVEGKRIPDGDPIAGYFPAIIDEKVFRSVNCRSRSVPGPIGDKVSNLFSKIAFDGYSGAVMRFVDKGTRKRGEGKWKYLVSDRRRTHPSAPPCTWKYPHFENLFLRFVHELDWKRVLSEGEESGATGDDEELASIVSEVQSLRDGVEKVLAAIQTTSDPPAALVKRLGQLETDLSEAEGRLALKEEDFKIRRQAIEEFENNATRLKQLALKATDREGRIRLRDEIHRKIARIDLYPRGLRREWQGPDYRVRINSAEPLLAVTFSNAVTRWVITIGNRPEALAFQEVGTGASRTLVIAPTPDGTRKWSGRDPLPPELEAWTESNRLGAGG